MGIIKTKMVSEKNEILGGGSCSGDFGGNGILGLIALLSIFRGNLFGGNYEQAGSELATLTNQLSNVRADIGDVKFNSISAILSQTTSLMSELSNGRIENLTAILGQTNQLQNSLNSVNQNIMNSQNELANGICASSFENAKGQMQLQRSIDQCCCETQRGILTMGYENQLATAALQNKMQECCCSTNLRMTELDYQGQLRDQANFAALQNGQTEIKCLIKDTAKDQELSQLRRESDRSFISTEIGRAIATTKGHWAADKSFFGPTYTPPTFPW